MTRKPEELASSLPFPSANTHSPPPTNLIPSNFIPSSFTPSNHHAAFYANYRESLGGHGFTSGVARGQFILNYRLLLLLPAIEAPPGHREENYQGPLHYRINSIQTIDADRQRRLPVTRSIKSDFHLLSGIFPPCGRWEGGVGWGNNSNNSNNSNNKSNDLKCQSIIKYRSIIESEP